MALLEIDYCIDQVSNWLAADQNPRNTPKPIGYSNLKYTGIGLELNPHSLFVGTYNLVPKGESTSGCIPHALCGANDKETFKKKASNCGG
jgi:hypothetical protein